MIFALIGAVLPRLISLFTKKTDDKTQVEVQGLKTVKYALRYHGLRFLVIVVVSVIVTIWSAEQVEQLIEGWEDWHRHTFHFFGAAGISGLLSRFL